MNLSEIDGIVEEKFLSDMFDLGYGLKGRIVAGFDHVEGSRVIFTILKYFEYEHLPEYLQEVSAPFHYLAQMVAQGSNYDPAETATALRKLLESKDAAVRAAIKPK